MFLPRDASAKRGYMHVVRPSVRPSVCLSVTIRYCDHLRWNTSKIISRPNSLRSMRSLTPNIGDLVQREHPQNYGRIGVGSGAHKTFVAPKRCKIGPKLLLQTNRKSHMRFRLAPNLLTLDDLERPKRPLAEIKSTYGAHQKNLNEDRHKLSAAKCSSMSLLSCSIRFV